MLGLFLQLVTFVSILVIIAPVKVTTTPLVKTVQPEEVPAYEAYNRAVAFNRGGDIDRAVEEYHMAISMKPRFPEAYQNLALIFDERGNEAKMEHCNMMAIESAGDGEVQFKATVMTNLAMAILRRHSSNDSAVARAMQILGHAREIDPRNENVLFNIGSAYFNLKEYKLANQTFTELLEINPSNGLANLNIGNGYFQQNLLNDAEIWFERAIYTIQEDDHTNKITAYSNKGQSHRQKGEYAKALADFKMALNYMDINNVVLIDLWLINNVVALKVVASQWEDFEIIEHLFFTHCTRLSVEVAIAAAIAGELMIDQFTFSLQRYTSLKDEQEVARASCRTLPSHRKEFQVDNEKHIRIGYLSYDWRNHPMGRLTKRLVLSHNRSQFTTFSISYGHNDGSSIRREIELKSENFVNIFHITNGKTAAETIFRMNLSILIDLTGHTYNGRIDIAARRPADIIINYLGYPGTTGCIGFDFNMVDARCMPPEYVSQAFTENVIYLPITYQAKSMPFHVDPCYNEKRQNCYHRLDITGLNHESDVKLICSFNANKKFEPVSWAVWMNILRRLPKSVLILMIDNKDIISNMLKELNYHGLSSNRVKFVEMISWEDHLQRTPACDIVLDTFVYGAHTTASDMLWMGVPIVSLESFGSGRMPARVAGSIVSSVFLTSDIDWSLLMIAYSVKEYEDLIFRLLNDDNTLTKLRHEILKFSLNGDTFDSNLMQYNVERAYHAVFELRSRKTMEKANIVVLHSNMKERSKSLLNDALEALLVCTKDVLAAHYGLKDTIQHMRTLRTVALRLEIGFPDIAEKLNLAEARALSSLCDMYVKLRGVLGLAKEPSYYPCHLYEGSPIECQQITDILSNYLNESTDRFMVRGFIYFSLKNCFVVDKSPVYALQFLLSLQNSLAVNNNLIEEETLFNTVSLLLFVTSKTLTISDVFVANYLKSVDIEFSDEHYYALSSVFLDSFSSENDYYIARELTSKYIRTHAVIQSDNNARRLYTLLASAHAIFPESNELKKDLGISLQGISQYEAGFQIMSDAIFRIQRIRFSSAIQSGRVQNLEYPQDAFRIAFYCYEYGNEWWPKWGPSSIQEGSKPRLGGSEEAVLYLAKALSKLNPRIVVDVYADPLEEDLGIDQSGVRWRHFSEFDPEDQLIDVFISWRYPASVILGKSAKKVFLWLHDILGPDSFYDKFGYFVDAVFVQSEFHRSKLPSYLHAFTHVLTHGLDALYHSTVSTINISNSNTAFIYASAPNRGLEPVLTNWGIIRKMIPGATLDVYYGLGGRLDEQLSKMVPDYSLWKEKMMRLLQQDGVRYHGMASHSEMATAFSMSGFLLYPSTFPETGCITVMKAMASGAIPITSRYVDSVLYHLTEGYDLGPSQALQNGMDYNSWLALWLSSIIHTKTLDADSLLVHRQRMIQDSRSRFNWDNTAQILLSHAVSVGR